MKKDYVPVSAADAAVSEDDYVHRYWTEKWSDPHLAVREDVTRSDVYRLIAPFARRLRPGARILDGGCGTGAWTEHFRALGFATVGLDISGPTIERLRMVVPAGDWKVGDIRRTGFPDAEFDAYYSWGTFEHFECGLGDAIAEAYRLLKPGGLLFISVPFQNWRHTFAASAIQDAQTSGPHRFYQWRLTDDELRLELTLRGFRVLKTAPVSKIEGVTRWIRHDLRIVSEGSVLFKLMWRLFARILPAAYVSHMILAVAERPA